MALEHLDDSGGEVLRRSPVPFDAFLTVLDRKPAEPMPEDEKEKWAMTTRRGKAMIVYDTWFNNLVRESKFSVTNKSLMP